MPNDMLGFSQPSIYQGRKTSTNRVTNQASGFASKDPYAANVVCAIDWNGTVPSPIDLELMGHGLGVLPGGYFPIAACPFATIGGKAANPSALGASGCSVSPTSTEGSLILNGVPHTLDIELSSVFTIPAVNGGPAILSIATSSQSFNSSTGPQLVITTLSGIIQFQVCQVDFTALTIQLTVNSFINRPPNGGVIRVRYCYTGDTILIFLNGKLCYSNPIGALGVPSSTTPRLDVGRLNGQGSFSWPANIYMHSLRITKGICRSYADYDSETENYHLMYCDLLS